jgi:hypothetical protein
MKKKSTSRSLLCKLRILIYLLLFCTTPIPARANIITVTNRNDSGTGSLRQALADANDGDRIDFAVTGAIGLTSGELLINKNVTIVGPGAANLAVDGSAMSRVFHISPGKTASISDLTITNGNVDSGDGGGILNDHAILTILDSTVTGNRAHDAGGGIFNDASNGGSATLTITNTAVNNNYAGFGDIGGGGGEGGGIYNSGGTLTITNSSVSDNYAGTPDPFPAGFGGGISNYGMLSITSATIDHNECWLAGGGIYNYGTLTITSSTVSRNLADGQHDGEPWGYGGGIAGTLTFTNSTLSGNYATLSGGAVDGGGIITNSTISSSGISVRGTLEIGNTILNAGASSPNIVNNGGTVTSHGYNLSSDDGGGYLTGPGDQINTDPILTPLQNNGGSTLTHALLPGSPAIDAGDPKFTPPPYYDERGPGFNRVFNGRIDVGSFEVQPTPTPTPTCTQYSVTEGTDTIVPGIDDTGNHCAWCDTLIPLPFPFTLYDQTFNAVNVTSSGRLDFVCNNEPADNTESCLPAPPNNCPYDFTIFALWHEWYTGTGATGCSTWANGCGIFTSMSGTAPNRIFNIEWHVVYRKNDAQTANFEVRLYENDPNKRFDVIYGTTQATPGYDGDAAGVQGPTGFFTQDFCDVLAPENRCRTYTMLPCGTPTPTPTPRATPRPRPTPRSRPSLPPRS